MKIEEILLRKGRSVVTITPDRTVLQAMRVLVEHRIGAVVVQEEDEVVGILSERDVLQLGARDPEELRQRSVGETMTRDVVVGLAEDDIYYAMNVMTENRIRHLPILRDGHLDGIVSIGDLVNACRREAETENRYLKDYIQGRVR